jgi:hypothetical protein
MYDDAVNDINFESSTMEKYSFLNHVSSRLGEFLNKHDFALDKSSSQISPSYVFNLLSFISRQCQIRVFVEHYRIYIEISALGVKDPNLWYEMDVMACFVSGTQPSQWIYNLPRGVPLRQVMEQQLTRWQEILEQYFDQIVPLFSSQDKLREMRETLNTFVRSYNAEQ